MTQPFLGEIRIFAGNFAPRGNAFCSGQIMAIAQNTALFSLLGTTFGGNGTSNFALPDLQGRAPLSQGQGLGVSLYDMGESTGTETVALTQTQLSAHTHPLQSRSSLADRSNANNAMLAQASDAIYTLAVPNTALNPASVGPSDGGSLPHNNMQPYLAMSFIIAVQGIYPARN